MRWRTDGRPHFLYRVFTEDGALLYIGLTVNPAGRFAHHRSKARWFPLAHHAEWECVGLVRSVAEVRELEAIRSERPLYNQQVNNSAALGAAIVDILDAFFPAGPVAS